jgi:mannosyltransferase OCH1-like enzyme
MIPKRIHLIWMQGHNSLPNKYASGCLSWADKNPSWKVTIWSRDTLPKLQNSWVLDIDDPTLQSDIARFEIVRLHGGIYVDCDTVCLKAIDPLVEKYDAFVSKRTPERLASSSFGATAEHPWLVDMVNEITNRRALLTHPGNIRGALERATRRHPEVERLPYSCLELSKATTESYALHYTDGEWRNHPTAAGAHKHPRVTGTNPTRDKWRPQQAM